MKTVSRYDIFMMGLISVAFATFFAISISVYPGNYLVLGIVLLAFSIIVLFTYGQLIKSNIIINLSIAFLFLSFLSSMIISLIIEATMPSLGLLIIMILIGIMGLLFTIAVYIEYHQKKKTIKHP